MEVKATLRKLDFPFCQKEALSRIEQLLASSQNCGTAQANRKANLANEIIKEFFFREVDHRGYPGKGLTSMQQLQLLEVLCDYVSYTGSGVAARNTVFMSLFNPMHPERNHILVKFVSMAIAINNSAALKATAILMQQQSSTSKFSMTLAEGIVYDYITLYTKIVNPLKDLPKSAPLFTVNFLTAVTEIYGVPLSDRIDIPQWVGAPALLLEIIINWIKTNDTLLVTALMVDLLPALPPGAIPMPAVTPYAGLLKWCILSALHETNEACKKLYIDLHLAVLTSLHDGMPKHCQRPEHLISATSLISIVSHVKKCVKITTEAKLDDCLIRLAQAVQISLHAKAVYGNQRLLIKQLESLPAHKLVQMVLKYN